MSLESSVFTTAKGELPTAHGSYEMFSVGIFERSLKESRWSVPFRGKQAEDKEPAPDARDLGTEQDSGEGLPGGLRRHVVEKEGLGATGLNWNRVLELASHATLSKAHNLSVPQLPHMQNGTMNGT